LYYLAGWHGGATGRLLDLRSVGRGREFNSYLGQSCITTLGRLFTIHTYVPLLPSSITWYWPRGSDA